jgi:hypothetical protein
MKVPLMGEGHKPQKEQRIEQQVLEKFVRLKLTDEIVEVTKWTSNSLTIIFKDEPITLRHDEIYHLLPEDLQNHLQRLNRPS